MENLTNKQVNKTKKSDKKNLSSNPIGKVKSPIENAPMISVPKNPFSVDNSTIEKVKETKTQVTYDYSDYVSDMYPISYYKDYIKNSNKFYKDINGVKASLKVKGNKVIYTVDIQYDSDYMKDLVEAGLVSTNGSYKDIEYISLQDTLKNQENAGLTCKEK